MRKANILAFMKNVTKMQNYDDQQSKKFWNF